MSLFHRHHWEITSQRFVPPSRRASAERISEDFAQQMMHGVTVTGLRCTSCGDIKSCRDAGDIRP